MENLIKKRLFTTILLLFSCNYLFTSDIDTDALEEDLQNISHDELQRVITDLETDEANTIKEQNRILWSIPAAFSDHNFDESVKDLHCNVPFKGKVSLGKDTYANYVKQLDKLKEKMGINVCEPMLDQLQQVDFDYHSKIDTLDIKIPVLQNYQVSILSWYKYLKGKRLPGIGLYKKDLKDITFLSASLASEYVLFKNIKNNKMNKTKDFLLANKSELIQLLEALENTKDNSKKEPEIADTKTFDPKVFRESQANFCNFIIKNCSLFSYNPLKREIIIPIIKYLFLQRILENLKEDKYAYLKQEPNKYSAFIKDKNRELVESAITPISIVTLAKIFITPILSFSETLKTHVSNAITGLRFTDKVFGNLRLPSFCYSKDEAKIGIPLSVYNTIFGTVGESTVCIMSIKILDHYFNDHLVNALMKNSEQLLIALKENQRLNNLENPDDNIWEQIKESDMKLEKLIEDSSSLHETSINSWLTAKRATFAKISGFGLMCFILPTIAINAYKIFNKIR